MDNVENNKEVVLTPEEQKAKAEEAFRKLREQEAQATPTQPGN